MKYLATNDMNSDSYTFDTADDTAARDWVINHLNLSLNWTIHAQVEVQVPGNTGSAFNGNMV
jgi:hypothetical protein